jgi:hypothetical protein
LSREVQAQWVVLVGDSLQQFGLHAVQIVFSMQGVRGRLRGEYAAVEIGGEHAIVRRQLDNVGHERSDRHRRQGSGPTAHRHNPVGVRTAPLRIDVLPEKLLNGILGRHAGRRGILIRKGRQGGQTGLRSGLDDDAVDGETEASRDPSAEYRKPTSRQDIWYHFYLRAFAFRRYNSLMKGPNNFLLMEQEETKRHSAINALEIESISSFLNRLKKS